MLIDDIDRYIRQRHSLGFAFRVPAYVLRQFGRFAHVRGDTAVRTQTTIEWASAAPSAPQRRERLQVVRRFARHMQAEDERYEVPPTTVFGNPQRRRRMPHIYTPDEVDALLRAAAQLTPPHSIRPVTYMALLSLLFASGLRISEALALQIDDTIGDALLVRKTKFRKSRLVPLHPTARAGLDRYLAQRQRVAARDRSVFISLCGTGSGMRRRTARFSRSPDRQASVPGLVCRDLACMMLDTRSRSVPWNRVAETHPRSRAISWP
jgi:integrase